LAPGPKAGAVTNCNSEYETLRSIGLAYWDDRPEDCSVYVRARQTELLALDAPHRHDAPAPLATAGGNDRCATKQEYAPMSDNIPTPDPSREAEPTKETPSASAPEPKVESARDALPEAPGEPRVIYVPPPPPPSKRIDWKTVGIVALAVVQAAVIVWLALAVSDLRNRAERADDRTSAITNDVARLREDLTALQDDLDAMRSQVTGLDNDVRALTGGVEDLQALGADLAVISDLAFQFDQATVDVVLGLDDRVNCLDASMRYVSDEFSETFWEDVLPWYGGC
jgi:hypothetical protein